MKGRFVVPIWGSRYVDLLCKYTLPTLLAPGNIPYLAQHMDLQFLFMTNSNGERLLREQQALDDLMRYCELKFVMIDEHIKQIPHFYGITLTYAYAKSVSFFGEEARDYYDFTLNADSLFAADSYTAVLERIRGGARLIFAPGLRVNWQSFVQRLDPYRDPTNPAIAIAHRPMVDMALQDLHWTVRAMTVNRPFLSLDVMYQIYWASRPGVLLAHQWQMANICFKPTRIPDEPRGINDFGIAEEYAPGTDPVVIGDSDEFLMLEPQSADWMRNTVRVGRQTSEEIGRFIGSWATPQHRTMGRVQVCYHSRDLTAADQAAGRKLAEEVERIYVRFPGKAWPYENHRFWAGSIAAYHAAAVGLPAPRPDDPLQGAVVRNPQPREEIRTRASRLYRALLGRLPRMRALHPMKTALEPAVARLRGFLDRTGDDCLVVTLQFGAVERFLIDKGVPGHWSYTRFADLVESRDQGTAQFAAFAEEIRRQPALAFEVAENRISDLLPFLSGIDPHILRDKDVLAFATGHALHSFLLDHGNLDVVARRFERIDSSGTLTFTGGPTGAVVDAAVNQIAAAAREKRYLRFLWWGLLFAIVAPAVILLRLIGLERPRGEPTGWPSGMILELSAQPLETETGDTATSPEGHAACQHV